MILPLVVIDVRGKVASDPDYQISMDDVRAWEAKYGPIPKKAFVAMEIRLVKEMAKRGSDA